VRAALVALLAATALVGAGCGAVDHITASEGDPSNGKTLFSAKCASCHVLADADAKGAVGPNLDDAFDSVREQGFDESTIRDVVRGQIAYAEEPMPQKLVVGEDADDVSVYVAKCAAVPSCGVTASGAAAGGGGGGTTTTETAPEGGGGGGGGKQLFTANCGGCHTLQDAGTTGQVGPNLDDAKPSEEKAETQVTNGGGGMPAFKDTLTAKQISDVTAYVTEEIAKK
jgi:mono/diheme cytochrome c family protein